MCGILFQHNPYTPAISIPATYPITEPEITTFISSSNTKHDIVTNSPSLVFESLIPKILHRGPNHAELYRDKHFSFFSSVLSLRSPFTSQPLISNRYTLQFNGELYNDDIEGNDTAYIIAKLEEIEDVEKVIRELDGEFAYIIHDHKTDLIHFGRDSTGKRSLVCNVSESEGLIISSVNPSDEFSRDQFIDCLNGVIYVYDVKEGKIVNEIPNDKVYVVTPSQDYDHLNKQKHIDALLERLSKAVSQRINSIQPYHDTPNHLYAFLFSGGLDCTVLASLAARLSPPGTVIDLLNVGFDNPRTGLKASEAPDRVLARTTWRELSKLHPQVTFQLIEVDVPYEEYLEIKPIVVDLMYPKNTEMDLSIAIAFYFASRGRGVKCTLASSDYETVEREETYQSPCKVLLSGLGADELYGGYHKFNSRDEEGLIFELNKQINGIYERNLQRDDKVVADNGVELRYPFLAHDVIKYSTEKIEINYKVSKLILRELAGSIGLEFVKAEPKRAIQFGAKSARMVPNGTKKGQAILE